MSYVDLMSDIRWNEQQHVRRTESLVREHWTSEDEVILNRKVSGAAMGKYQLVAQDLVDIADFNAVTTAAQEAGMAARIDSGLLNAALDYEQAQNELATLPPAPEEGEDPFGDLRSRLVLVMSVSEDVLQLVQQRAAFRAPVEINNDEEVSA